MHRWSIALAALLAVTSPLPALAQGMLEFTLSNLTGFTITEVYVGPSSGQEWGNNRLGRFQFTTDQNIRVKYRDNALACKWDIAIVYEDGDKGQLMDVDLCQLSRVVLQWDFRNSKTRFDID